MVAERRARRVRWAVAEGEGMVVIFIDWFFLVVGSSVECRRRRKRMKYWGF